MGMGMRLLMKDGDYFECLSRAQLIPIRNKSSTTFQLAEDCEKKESLSLEN